MLNQGSEGWISALARFLPYHQDQYFLMLQAAVHGQYKPRFSEGSEPDQPKEPSALRAVANRALDAFSNRADQAMRAYQQRKAQGRV